MHRNQLDTDNDRPGRDMHRGSPHDRERGSDDDLYGVRRAAAAYRMDREDHGYGDHSSRRFEDERYSRYGEEHHDNDEHERGRWGSDYDGRRGHRYYGGMIDDGDQFRRDEARFAEREGRGHGYDPRLQDRDEHGRFAGIEDPTYDRGARRSSFGRGGYDRGGADRSYDRSGYGRGSYDRGPERDYGPNDNRPSGYDDRYSASARRVDYDDRDVRARQVSYDDRYSASGRRSGGYEGRSRSGYESARVPDRDERGRPRGRDDHYEGRGNVYREERTGYARGGYGRDERVDFHGRGSDQDTRHYHEREPENERRWVGGGFEEDRRGRRW